MTIQIVLRNGNERSVSKADLQRLINQERVMFFQRSEGWVVIGRDKLREPGPTPIGKRQKERRTLNKSSWH